jgi:hypothetical protein
LSGSEISEWRATVLERSINVEWLVNATISQHYFGKVMDAFVLQVLNDEYFSFGLKRSILSKILGKNHKKLIGHLHRIGEIRNRFAHSAPHVVTTEHPGGFAPDPKNPKQPVDFAALYAEFENLCPMAESELAAVFAAKGGVLGTTPWPAV